MSMQETCHATNGQAGHIFKNLEYITHASIEILVRCVVFQNTCAPAVLNDNVETSTRREFGSLAELTPISITLNFVSEE